MNNSVQLRVVVHLEFKGIEDTEDTKAIEAATLSEP